MSTLKINITVFFCICLSNFVIAQNIHTFNIYFDTDQYSLKTIQKNYLEIELDSMKQLNIYKIEIIGHTDNSADSLYNIKLSDRRANDVKRVLELLGFNDNIIDIGYFGENKPIVENDNPKDKGLNRRAEIIVYFTNLEQKCTLGDTIIRTKGGKEIVFDGCEYKELENCIEIIEDASQNDYKKGIIVVGNPNAKGERYGKLQVNLLDGCSKSNCFRNPVRIRLPLYTIPDPDNMPWVLLKGEKVNLLLIQLNNKWFYEFELKCPTSWINCNCKKNQKH